MTGQQIKNILLKLEIQPSSGIYSKQPCIILRYQYNCDYTRIIKANKGAWSTLWNAWFIPRNKYLLVKIIKSLAEVKGLDIKRQEVKEMTRRLELKSYSQSTIKNYCGAFEMFLDYFYPANTAKSVSVI